MRATRFALIALAAVVLSAFTARPASAAPWQLCLRLNFTFNFRFHLIRRCFNS